MYFPVIFWEGRLNREAQIFPNQKISCSHSLFLFFVVTPPLSAAALKQLGKKEEEEEGKGKGRFGGDDGVGGGAPSSSSCVIWATVRKVQTNFPQGGREGGVSHYTLWVFDRLDGICLDKS